jgi:hypothetical protein
MKTTILIFLLITGTVASAQQLWIQPQKFIHRRGETVNLRFLTGDFLKGHNWRGSRDNVDVLRLSFGDVVDKNLDDNLSDQKGDSIQFASFDEGTIVVSLQTKTYSIKNDSAARHLFTDSSEFLLYNDTLMIDSITFVYSVKNVLQVGGKTSNSYKEKTGLPIDIIPKEHPYAVKKDGNFKLKLFLWDEVLKNTKVRVLHKLNNKISEFEYMSDDEGELKFFLSAKGQWMIRCVKTVKIQTDKQVEWKTYVGILTWGYY